MYIALIIVSLVVALWGFTMINNATAGVGLICVSCLLAIYARLVQASKHHNERRRRNH